MSGEHQRLILQRALVAGAAGLLPVPYLDEYLAGEVRASLIRKLAEAHGVEMDEYAVATVVRAQPSPLIHAAGLGAFALAGARRAWRKIAATLLIVRRVDEALQTFQVGTLFDHYCGNYEVGLRLDVERAVLLRATMDRAVRSAHADAIERAFRQVLHASIALTLVVPRRALGLWTRLRGGNVKPGPLPPFEAQVEAAESSAEVQRGVRAVERSAAGSAHGYVDGLRQSFDRLWRARQPES